MYNNEFTFNMDKHKAICAVLFRSSGSFSVVARDVMVVENPHKLYHTVISWTFSPQLEKGLAVCQSRTP